MLSKFPSTGRQTVDGDRPTHPSSPSRSLFYVNIVHVHKVNRSLSALIRFGRTSGPAGVPRFGGPMRRVTTDGQTWAQNGSERPFLGARLLFAHTVLCSG